MWTIFTLLFLYVKTTFNRIPASGWIKKAAAILNLMPIASNARCFKSRIPNWHSVRGVKSVQQTAMSMFKVVRTFTNNQVFRQNLSRLLSNVQFCARFASESARFQSGEQDFDKEAYNRRQKRLVAAIIGSSVGLIGSSYCLYRKLSKANAQSPNAALDSRNPGGEKNSDENKEEETDGKSKKGKHGFRERRVRKFALLLRLRQTCYLP